MGNSYNKLKVPIALSNIYYNSKFYMFSKNQRLFFKKFNHKYRLFYSILVIKNYSRSISSIFKSFKLFLKESLFYINRVVYILSNKLDLNLCFRGSLTAATYHSAILATSFKKSSMSSYYIYINNFLLHLILYFYKSYYSLILKTFNNTYLLQF